MADSIIRLRVESQEYDQKLRRATEGLQRYIDSCKKAGGTLEVVEKDTEAYTRALGKMEASSRTASGKINEMKTAFTELSLRYKKLTDEEKASPFGRALSQSLDQLKGRIRESQGELRGINAEMVKGGSAASQFNSILQELGGRLGVSSELTSMLTSGTIGMTAAIGTAATAVAYAAKQFSAYNKELAYQGQITSVTTGLKGPDADRMTSAMRALARTYSVDFREAVNAANTLMSQFGIAGDEAISLIKDGMQGMIAGDGGKLLQLIQQYAPAFRDAGVSASELVAVIQNSEGGLFTAENMNAIVMGIKNIRLMTEPTAQALAKLGVDGHEMTRQLTDGSLSIFDALRQVSEAITQAGTSSQEVGQVMQQVFGRQGAMAGTNLAEAIRTLNTNLEETKRQTGELGQAYADLQTANEDLERAMRSLFSVNGWEEWTVMLETRTKKALATVLQGVKDLAPAILRVAGLWSRLIPGAGGVIGNWLDSKGKDMLTPERHPAMAQQGMYGLMSTDNPIIAHLEMQRRLLEGNKPQQGTSPVIPPLTPRTPTATPRTAPANPVDLSSIVMPVTPVSIKDRDADNIWGFSRYQQNWQKEKEGYSADEWKEIITGKKPEKGEEDKEEKKEEKKERKKQTTALERVTKAVSGLTTVMSGLEALGIELPKGMEQVVGVIQSLCTIAQGVNTIIQAISVPSETANTISLDALTSAVTANTIAIMARPFSKGGIAFEKGGVLHAATGVIAGQSYAGDRIPVAINSGEMVINQADQRKLFDAIHGDQIGIALGGMKLVLKGEDIYLAQKNYRKGVGL
jgi:hypothetical protein